MRKLVAAVALASALALPASPAAASEPSPIVHTKECPEGYTGKIVYVYDRGLWWGCYRLP
jgi:hypothetical protein